MSSSTSNKVPEQSESELIASARAGDNRAFEALAESYKRMLDYHIRRLNAQGSIYDDLFQEGLIGLLKAVRTYDGTSAAFSTYASRCVHNSVVSALRKYNGQAKNGEPDPAAQTYESYEFAPSAEEETLGSIYAGVLYGKVSSSLSDYEKLIFDMYLSDLSYESISFVTGKDVKSIENAVYRIRRKLKNIITSEGAAEQDKSPKGFK